MPKRKTEKPDWPYKHITSMTADMARNQWVKKIRGRIYNFGVLDDPDAALAKYQRIGADLHAGRQPRTDENRNGLTLTELCGRYLMAVRDRCAAGELTAKTLRDYEGVVVRVLETIDPATPVDTMGPEHFGRLHTAMKKRLGVERLSGEIRWTRRIFNWAASDEVGLIEKVPRFGVFKVPTAREKRLAKAQTQPNLFSPDDVRRMLTDALPSLRAPILLGLNGGLGNHDISELRWKHVDLDEAMIRFPRPKTGIDREFVLWRETADALRDSRKQKNKPRNSADTDRVFLTSGGHPLQHDNTDALHLRFRRLLVKLGLVEKYGEGEAEGVGFYTLRRTFRTYADTCGDQHAVHRVMGHEIPGMSGIYVQRIDRDRLQHVSDHVYNQLFRDWTCKLENENTPGQ